MAAVPTIGRATGVERKPAAPEADATRALYEQYSRQILNYCVHQLNSREEAEDAVQTTFMNAFRGLKRGVVPEAEQAWLFKIAENVCLSRRRSSWRRGKVESPNDFEVLQEIVPSKHANRADELIGLEDALEAMPENQRRAILLREWQGLSYREIAGELELSQAAVETLIFRARRSLAAGLESPVTPKRRRSRISAAGDGLSLGSLIAGLKSILTGGAAVKAVAVAVAAGSATLAATQAEPALVHHLRHIAKPAAVVHITKQSQVTFSSQATVVARASGLTVEQAHTQSDRGASMNNAVAKAGRAGHAHAVTMPEDTAHAQAAPTAPMVPTTAPTVPAATPATPAPEAPIASAPAPAAVPRVTPTEQPKTEQPRTEQPKTAAPKSEPTNPGDSPGKSGNDNNGKRPDSGAKTDTPKTETPKSEPTKGTDSTPKTTSDAPKSTPTTSTSTDTKSNGNSDNKNYNKSDNRNSSDKQKVVVTPSVATPPATPAPAAVTQAPTGNNGNDKDKGKAADKKSDSPAPAPVAAAPVVAAPQTPTAPVAPPVQPTNSPMHGNGNGNNGNDRGDNSSKDNGGDKGKGKGK